MSERGVESTCGASPAAVEILKALGRPGPWTWVGTLFALQAAGSVVVSRVLGLAPSDVAFPIAILVLGAATAFLLRFVDRHGRLGVWKWWLAPIIYGAFIFLLSNRSFEVSSPSFSGNYFHPVEYMTLGFLACLAWHPVLRCRSTWLLFVAVMCSGFLFAVTDEVHQHFIPGREMSGFDLCLDALGLGAGFGAFLLLQRIRRLVAVP